MTFHDHRIIARRFVVRQLFRQPKRSSWYVRIRDLETGKVVTRSTGESAKGKANLRAVEIAEKLALDAGLLPGRPPAFEGAFREWLALKSDIREATRTAYLSDFERVYVPVFGKIPVKSVTLAHIEKFLASLAKKGATVRTRKKHLGQLRSFFRWAVLRQYAISNPTEGIRLRGEKPRDGRALAHEQARALLVECCKYDVIEMSDRRRSWKEKRPPSPGLWLAVLVALHTGLRRKNVLGLKWEDVDLGRRRISIPGPRMKNRHHFETGIHPELADALRQELRRQGKVDGTALVIGRKIKSFEKSFKSAARRAGIPGEIWWHCLRHTFGTWCEDRFHFALYQKLMGHTPKTVSEKYVHITFEKMRDAIDALPRLATEEKDREVEGGVTL